MTSSLPQTPPAARSPRAARVRHRRRYDEVLREDKGYIMALTALLIIPLCVAVAFAVDVGSWYAQNTRMQRAADAAALAGVVYMPDAPTAYAVAREVAAKNGFPAGSGNTITPSGTGNKLTVSISSPGNTFFAPAGGVKNELLNRSATAEYLVSIQMGSPLNYAGNDPDLGTVPTAGVDGSTQNYPQFWLNSAGYATNKINGDQFTAGQCGGANYQCGGAYNPPNAQFEDKGYLYAVNVGATHGPLSIQVYDPAAVNVGDTCTGGNDTTGGNRAVLGNTNALVAVKGTSFDDNAAVTELSLLTTQFANAGITTTPTGTPLNIKYRWSRTDQTNGAAFTSLDQLGAKKYCNGDWITGYGKPVDIKTTYIVRAPDATPLDNLDNPPICAITFDAYAQKGNAGVAPKVLNFSVFQKIASRANQIAAGYPDPGVDTWNTNAGTENMPFWKHFHQYVNICNIANPVTGRYIVQVRNNADMTTAPAATTTATTGLTIGTLGGPGITTGTQVHNRLTMRAGWTTYAPAGQLAAGGVNWAQDISLTADNKFPIYTNQTGSDTTFYVARLTPEYKGHKVQLSLWDIGDGSAPFDLTILPPAEACAGAYNSPACGPNGAITSCDWDRDGATVAPKMPTEVTFGPAQCEAGNLTSGSFNGHLTNATILLDSNYNCNVASGLGCWFRIKVVTSGAPADTTTWSANVLGNPVHLTK